MSLRARIFIIVSVIVLVILGVSLFLVISARQKAAGGGTATTTAQGGGAAGGGTGLEAPAGTTIPAGLPVKKQSTVEVEQAGVEKLAAAFTERYGTYSTQNESENIKEVQTLCTRSLWQTLSARIGASAGQGFVGVTTRVINTDLVSWKATEAVVSLRTMRTEEKNGVTANKYQNAEATLIKSGDQWLVDEFAWQ